MSLFKWLFNNCIQSTVWLSLLCPPIIFFSTSRHGRIVLKWMHSDTDYWYFCHYLAGYIRLFALLFVDCAGHYGNALSASVFFNVCVVSISPAEFSPSICAFLELCSNANLPCLVNLAICFIPEVTWSVLSARCQFPLFPPRCIFTVWEHDV